MKNNAEQHDDYWFLEFNHIRDTDYHRARKGIEAGPHPTDRLLYDYVLGWIEEEETEIISRHLLLCGICAQEVLNIREAESTIERKLSDWLEHQKNIEGRSFRIPPATLPSHTLSETEHQHAIATEYWEPLLAGQRATAACIPTQEHLFRREDGDIKVSCFWRARYHDKPAFIKISWNANIKVRSEIRAHFINPDTHELRSEIRLGTQLAGEEWFTSHELGFDPSSEKWAIAIIVQEIEE